MVAQRFAGWAGSIPPFLMAYDDEPPPGGDLPFTQYWIKAAREGLRADLADFSLGSACARLGRVPVAAEDEDETPLAASYGYHLDALSYSELVKQLALRSGVELAGDGVRQVDVEGERITGIDLIDGTRLTADLYLDGSGAEGRLIGAMPGAQFDPWRAWLPLDRRLAASGPRLPNLPAFSQISAFDAGWVGLFALQNRTAVVAVYSSDRVSDRAMAEQIPAIARMPIGGEATVSAVLPGLRQQAWIGNCVAIGESAIAADPIDALTLHIAHGCISHLMTLFPATSEAFPEALAYNRSIASFGANLRDFQAAHYKLNRRFGDPLWDDARAVAAPASLARKLDLFAARGAIALNDDESFFEQGWAALLVVCGMMPEDYDPRVDSVADEVHIEKVQQRLRMVAATARRMPPVDEFLGIGQAAAAQVGG
jgi:tryptophan halogenase